MTFIAPVSAITARFSAQWALTDYSAMQVVLDNEIEDPPTPDPSNAIATSYVRQTFLPTDVDHHLFSGARENWQFGLVTYDVFTPLGAGLGYAAAIAETIRTFFDRTEAGGVVYIDTDGSGPRWETVGPDMESGFYHVQVTVPWQFFDESSGTDLVSCLVLEEGGDPADPPDGAAVIWMADGSGTGSAGDIMIKITSQGSTETVTLIDYSAIP